MRRDGHEPHDDDAEAATVEYELGGGGDDQSWADDQLDAAPTDNAEGSSAAPMKQGDGSAAAQTDNQQRKGRELVDSYRQTIHFPSRASCPAFLTGACTAAICSRPHTRLLRPVEDVFLAH